MDMYFIADEKMEKKSIKILIENLEKTDKKAKNARLVARIIKVASLPKRRRVSVNLEKLNELAKPGENILVPGKILGTGKVEKAFGVAAIEFSESSTKKLREAGCTIMSVEEMLKKENTRLLV